MSKSTPPPIIDRTLERTFLSAVLGDSRHHAKISSLNPAVFDDKWHRAWASAIVDVHKRTGGKFSVDNVLALFSEQGIEPPGGPTYLAPTAESMALDVPQAWSALWALRSRRVAQALGTISMADATAEAIERFRARTAGSGGAIELPWLSLNRLYGGGLYPGCHQVVGCSGAGKSQFALGVAYWAAAKGIPVHYVALELGAEDVVARLMGIHFGAWWSEIWKGRHDAEWLVAAKSEIDRLLPTLTIEPASPLTWTYETLAERGKALREQNPAAGQLLLVVDFLQLVGAPKGERVDTRERISRAVYAAREVARQYGVTVLALSSTGRANYEELLLKVEKGTGKLIPPQPNKVLGTGKESGDTEYASDSVMVLVHEDKAGVPRFAACVLAKHRLGPTDTVALAWNGNTYADLAPPPVAVPAATPSPGQAGRGPGAPIDDLIV